MAEIEKGATHPDKTRERQTDRQAMSFKRTDRETDRRADRQIEIYRGNISITSTHRETSRRDR